MEPEKPSNFSRFDHWTKVLGVIRRYYTGVLETNKKAIRIRPPPGSPIKHSIGVTSVLDNYYRQSEEDVERIAAAPDRGIELGKRAWRHAIDSLTAERFKSLTNNKYMAYEATLNTVTQLGSVHLAQIDKPEFRVGSPTITVLETPNGDERDWKFLVGAIDMFLYNYETGQLVLCEAKSGFSDQLMRNSPLYMAKMFLKEKHVKQLTLYAWMLIKMSHEAGVPIAPEDIQLVILADDRNKHMSEIWSFPYDPVTFLGSVWARDRWVGFVDTNLLLHRPVLSLECMFCKTKDNLIKTITTPVKVVCKPCYSVNRCACGKLVRYKYAGKRVCGRDCKKLFIKTPPPTIELD